MEDIGIKILLPGIILAIKVLFKLFIGQNPEEKDYRQVFIDLPVDITFLGVSFLLASVIIHPEYSMNYASLLIYVALAFIVVLLTRLCRNFSDAGSLSHIKKIILFLAFAFNYNCSSFCLYKAGNMLQEATSKKYDSDLKSLSLNVDLEVHQGQNLITFLIK